jgi:uncharacterized protein YidB (DUF937 family)
MGEGPMRMINLSPDKASPFSEEETAKIAAKAEQLGISYQEMTERLAVSAMELIDKFTS